MVAAIVLALTLFVGATLAAPSERLVTGTKTSTSVHPSIVQLDFFRNGVWIQACAATVVTNVAVVTTASCTHVGLDHFYRPENRRIRAGADYKNTGGQLAYAQSVLVHPNFDFFKSLDDDISIIRLSSFLVFGNNVGFISIMPPGFNIPDNSPVVFAAWGEEDNDGLYEARVLTINHEECTRRYAESTDNVSVTKNNICAGLLDVGGEDGCIRDLGGPLYYQNILAGMLSFGPCTCGDPHYPAVLTSISSYSDWIVANA